MDIIKDAYVLRLVEQIGEHYRSNIANRFIRPALLQLSLGKETWDQIEAFTGEFKQVRYHGFHLDEMYRQVGAMSKFVFVTRLEVAPILRHRLSNVETVGNDTVLRNMAINNFALNLKSLADMLHELYLKLIDIDTKNAKGKKPLYQQTAELDDIENQLITY